MADVFTSVSTALNIANRLQVRVAIIRNAELAHLLGQLHKELAQAKLTLAAFMEENTALRAKVHDLHSGVRCPKCHKPGWHVANRIPDSLSALQTYQCPFCGYVEEELAEPR